MWPENPRKLRESSAKDPRKPWLAGMAPPDLIGEWQCPLRSGARGVWLCPLRSAVAVGVRQCPLKSGARGWGPAVPTEIWSSRLRVGWRTRRWRRRRPPDAISIQMLPQWQLCCKTMSVVLGIKGFNTHFTAENGELLSRVFRESSRKWISDTWTPRKKNPASRKVRERDGEREDRIEHKVAGFRQPLSWICCCCVFWTPWIYYSYLRIINHSYWSYVHRKYQIPWFMPYFFLVTTSYPLVI